VGEKGHQRLLPSVLNDLHLEDQKMGYLDWERRQIQSGEMFISSLQAEEVGIVSALDVLNCHAPTGLNASEWARLVCKLNRSFLYAKRNTKERQYTEIRYGLLDWGVGGELQGRCWSVARPDIY